MAEAQVAHTSLGTVDENHLAFHHHGTFATLPTASNAGRLARVTDTTRGLWMDDGTHWSPIGPYVNALDFGPAADGVTDDRVPLQAALTAATGKTLYIPKGTYVVSWTTNGGLSVPSNTTILMDPSTIIKAGAGWLSDKGVFQCNTVTNVKFYNGQIDGQRSLQTKGCFGIQLLTSSYVWIEGMYIHAMLSETVSGVGGDAVQVRGTSNPGSEFVWILNNRFEDCQRQGVSITRGKHIWICNNHIEDIDGTNPGGGIDCEPDDASAEMEDIHIVGNYIADAEQGVIVNTGSAGDSIGGKNIKIESNTIREIRRCNIRVDGNWVVTSTDPTEGLLGLSIINNTLYSDNTEISGSAGMMSLTRAGGGTLIQGNHFIGFGTAGSANINAALNIEFCRRFSVLNNTFINTRVTALRFTLTSSGVSEAVFSHNRFTNCANTNVVDFVLSGGGEVTDIIFTENMINDNRSSKATNGINFTGITAAMLGSWRIENNRISGPTNKYSTVPTGAGIIERRRVGTAALNFDLTSVDTEDLPLTVTGVLVAENNSVSLSVPKAVAEVAGIGFATPWVSADNTVTVRAFRIAGTTPNPASGTFVAVVTTTNT